LHPELSEGNIITLCVFSGVPKGSYFIPAFSNLYIIRIPNPRLQRNHPLQGTKCRSVICIKCYNPADVVLLFLHSTREKKSTSCIFRDLKSDSVVRNGAGRGGWKSSAGDFTLMGLTYMADLCYCSFTFFFYIRIFVRSADRTVREVFQTSVKRQLKRTLSGVARRSCMRVSYTVGTIRLLNSLSPVSTKSQFLSL